MEQVELENILYQILYGIYYIEHNDIRYKCVPNTLQDKYESVLIYNQVMTDIKYEEMLTWEQAQRISELSKIWTTKDEAGLKDLEKIVENLKLQLFLNYTNPMSIQQLKKKLKQVQHGINKSHENKFKLHHATKEYHAENVKREFLLAVSIRDKSGQQLYNMDSFWNSDNTLIQSAMFQSSVFPIDKIRKIARSEPWRSMWTAQKGDALGKPSCEWTDQQRYLVSFSKMYDNVYESTECPPEEVIEDDDILDGWFIKQRKDREESKQTKSSDHHFGSHKGQGNQELFVMARDQQEAQTISNQNDVTGKQIVQTRKELTKQAGEEGIKDSEMPDVQRELQMQAVRSMKEKLRR